MGRPDMRELEFPEGMTFLMNLGMQRLAHLDLLPLILGYAHSFRGC